MKTIRWGILGAGDVAEVKSGPAFRNLPGSELVAVMRRDAERAADFARRHGVPRWYSESEKLLADPDIDAIYVATPPSSHAALTSAALAAGKFVYVEKPISTDTTAADTMLAADAAAGGDHLVVAHYRRALPLFEAIRTLLDDNAIGDVRQVDIRLTQLPPIGDAAENWRHDPAISGGGLFHDLAPHQLDLIIHWFGIAKSITTPTTLHNSPTAELIQGEFITVRDILVRGLWDFRANEITDECVITGTTGTLRFPFFSTPILTTSRGGDTDIQQFTHPTTVQQPHIERVNRFFRREGPNPCPPSEARHGLALIEAILHSTQPAGD